ncbi:unnamed protein product [Closterium sp. NIES-64]|nr:unnamed protein product [Closterium sp. NIES-64]
MPRQEAGREGGKSKWHIYLPPGVWCSSAAECVTRSKTSRGNSKFSPDKLTKKRRIFPSFTCMFSSSSRINPPFHNWNSVRLIYCDGGGYQGTTGRLEVGNGTVLYLDGWNIVQAVMEDLKSKHIIQSATHVLLSGTSAGGQAVLFLCDRIAAAFPEAATKCVCDSGFFIVVSGLPPGNTATNPICRSHHCLSHTLLPSYRKGGIHMARPYSKDWKGGNTWRDTIKSTAAHEASHERSHTLLEH